METDVAAAIAEAYRWQRRLGNTLIETPHCHIVANSACPDVWDANHADTVTARTDDEMRAVFAAMDRNLRHSPWRVIHTDRFTPDEFLARLAFEDFEEQTVTIQMVRSGGLTGRGTPVVLRPVTDDNAWEALHGLVADDHAEGQRTGARDLTPAVTAGMVAGYRAKSEAYHFHLAIQGGIPVGYGAYAAAPNGAGMIEDLFTLPSARRQGIASALISIFTDRLREAGCHTIFLGALASGQPKNLYARLGFRPVGLARAWVRKVPAAA